MLGPEPPVVSSQRVPCSRNAHAVDTSSTEFEISRQTGRQPITFRLRKKLPEATQPSLSAPESGLAQQKLGRGSTGFKLRQRNTLKRRRERRQSSCILRMPFLIHRLAKLVPLRGGLECTGHDPQQLNRQPEEIFLLLSHPVDIPGVLPSGHGNSDGYRDQGTDCLDPRGPVQSSRKFDALRRKPTTERHKRDAGEDRHHHQAVISAEAHHPTTAQLLVSV